MPSSVPPSPIATPTAHAAAGTPTRIASRHGSAAVENRCLAPFFHPRTRPATPSGSVIPSAMAACATVGLVGGSDVTSTKPP